LTFSEFFSAFSYLFRVFRQFSFCMSAFFFSCFSQLFLIFFLTFLPSVLFASQALRIHFVLAIPLTSLSPPSTPRFLCGICSQNVKKSVQKSCKKCLENVQNLEKHRKKTKRKPRQKLQNRPLKIGKQLRVRVLSKDHF